ncbi:hypothetical protein OOT46_08125 [Aquabacterium sp. A7-Y]|uniref:hypothetical protein n=1 Tax=Aquabacterium sp. A7-Y TaxID=1349605 RepID=UPI00223DE162|nr:hypothetical protein [Aquabacterium sp. A7-Y]MCW7537815.1 hypothetical protein [Aquabacterium sp. A7-Y]
MKNPFARSEQRSRRPGGPGDWVLVPSSPAEVEQVARYCRRLVNQRALMAAGVAVVPVPGLDWLADVGVLVKLFGEINHAFGLTPEQVERLSPNRRVYAYKAISAAGGFMVGRVVTRELVIRAVKLVGVRLSAQQAAKFVPLAGQAVSAALTFSALKLVCEQHIRQCMEVARVLQQLPAPDDHAAAQATPIFSAG